MSVLYEGSFVYLLFFYGFRNLKLYMELLKTCVYLNLYLKIILVAYSYI